MTKEALPSSQPIRTFFSHHCSIRRDFVCLSVNNSLISVWLVFSNDTLYILSHFCKNNQFIVFIANYLACITFLTFLVYSEHYYYQVYISA